jgi:hypothetical protein
MDDSEAQFALTNYSCKLWRDLKTTCLDPSSTNRAARFGCADDEEMEEVRRKRITTPSAALELKCWMPELWLKRNQT